MKYRVKRYIADDWSGYQILQKKFLFFWFTIDKEEIPSHISISLATVGDTAGWKSKFSEYIL